MEDDRLVEAFETGELSGHEFSHTEHVRVAWWYLTHGTFGEARHRFSTALRRFAAANGAAGRYHETITVAYLLLIADRLQKTPERSWSGFAERHADLLARNLSVLAHYLSFEALVGE